MDMYGRLIGNLDERVTQQGEVIERLKVILRFMAAHAHFDVKEPEALREKLNGAIDRVELEAPYILYAPEEGDSDKAS